MLERAAWQLYFGFREERCGSQTEVGIQLPNVSHSRILTVLMRAVWKEKLYTRAEIRLHAQNSTAGTDPYDKLTLLSWLF